MSDKAEGFAKDWSKSTMQTRPNTSLAWRFDRTHPAQRVSIDWQAIERDYRAGQLSLRDMAGKHGCSHSAIANHADRHGWTRVRVVNPQEIT